jgi:hypothetical protein
MSSEKEQSTKVSVLWLQQCLCMDKLENGKMKTVDVSAWETMSTFFLLFDKLYCCYNTI